MIKLNFTPLWYIETRRNKVIKLYKKIIISLEAILILSSLAFIVTYLGRNSLNNKSNEINNKIENLVTTSTSNKYNLDLIERFEMRLPKNIDYSEMFLENNTIFIDFKYTNKKNYTDNLKLLEKVKGFKITFIGTSIENEKGTYYRVGIKKDEKY